MKNGYTKRIKTGEKDERARPNPYFAKSGLGAAANLEVRHDESLEQIL